MLTMAWTGVVSEGELGGNVGGGGCQVETSSACSPSGPLVGVDRRGLTRVKVTGPLGQGSVQGSLPWGHGSILV